MSVGYSVVRHVPLVQRRPASVQSSKETKLERDDFTLQLLMFVTAEKERLMFIILFLSIFCQLLFPRFLSKDRLSAS